MIGGEDTYEKAGDDDVLDSVKEAAARPEADDTLKGGSDGTLEPDLD